MNGTIRITIRRGDRGEFAPSKIQAYEIRTEVEMTVLEVLDHIFYRLDATLAHRRYRCGRRLCGSCEVKVDGRTVRGCAFLLRPGGSFLLEPARPEALIRDLVCDFDPPG
jgi:succinate dehydrogenase/fumarate reductase-like Fe-S protein